MDARVGNTYAMIVATIMAVATTTNAVVEMASFLLPVFSRFGLNVTRDSNAD